MNPVATGNRLRSLPVFGSMVARVGAPPIPGRRGSSSVFSGSIDEGDRLKIGGVSRRYHLFCRQLCDGGCAVELFEILEIG